MLHNHDVKKVPLFILFPLAGLVYIFLGKVSLFFASMPEGIAIAWFPNGLLLSLFLFLPYKEWKWLVFVIVPAEILADIGSFSIVQSLQFACVNLAETSLAAWLIRRMTKANQRFYDTRYFLLFSVIALIVAPSISAIFGALIYHTQIETQTDFIAFWRIWFFGDSLGILLLAPLLITWLDVSPKAPLVKRSVTEAIFATIVVLSLAFAIFSQPFIPSILPATPIIFILLSLWIVYRQGLRVSMFLGVCVSMIGIYYTVEHKGPFSIFDAVQNTLYLQEFMAALMTSILFFGVLLRQLTEKNIELLEANSVLQEQVELICKQNEFLELQSRQAAMGEMIDVIAHQWKQPLNIIALYNNLLLDMVDDNVADMNNLQKCHDVTRQQLLHLGTTLDEFRDFFRPNKTVSQFSLSHAIQDVLLLVKHDLSKHNIIANVHVNEEGKIVGFENEFKHVMINFINNAKDAFIEKGIEERTIDIVLHSHEKECIIDVMDNAGGIPEKIMEDIFKPNFTTKSEGKGTGMGLYMSKMILTKIGARLSVKNHNKGACFTIVFPCV